MTTQKVINWNRPMLKRFKKAFETAEQIQKSGGSDTFIFNGNEFVVGYAKYLIQYLEKVLPK